MSARAATGDAALWAIRLEEGQLSAQERKELDAWLEAAPHHRGALVRARAVWFDLDRLGSLERPGRVGVRDAAALPAIASPHAVAPPIGAPPIRAARAASTRKSHSFRWSVAIALAAIAIYGLKLHFDENEYRTRIGEVRRITLEDGSVMILNSDSQAEVRFEKARRLVKLERGEGLFEVAKNKSRPFWVRSGEISVRAVGTVFAVRASAEAVAVTVTEGVVEISQPRATPRRVSINEFATVRPKAAIEVATEDPASANRHLAWRSGLISFAGESLGEAAREENRYSKRQIVIEDPKLASQPVVGIFRMGDVDAFVQAAAGALGADVRANDGIIRLVARPAR